MPNNQKDSTEKQSGKFILKTEFINDIVIESLHDLIRRAKHSHMCDVSLRENGKDVPFQADWIKYMEFVPDPVPSINVSPPTAEQLNDAGVNPHMFEDVCAALDHIGGDHNMRRDRPYMDQEHLDTGIRGMTEIKGITFRDLRDCFLRAMVFSHLTMEEDGSPIQPNHTLYIEAQKGEHGLISENDIYELKGEGSFLSVKSNLCCEVEKIMGIFPNVPGLKEKNNG